MASADGLRFVVPVRTVHAGPNPKYFGIGRGVTYYNLVSDQFTGLHGITVPGTLRDSLVLLAVALEQQTELQPTQIMTDTGAYSDVVFGLFRLLGYRFSPRLADIGGTRFWRIDSPFGETTRWGVGPAVKLKLRKARADGRSTALLAAFTVSFSRRARKSVTLAMTRSPARRDRT